MPNLGKHNRVGRSEHFDVDFLLLLYVFVHFFCVTLTSLLGLFWYKEYQKHSFSKYVVDTLFNIITGKPFAAHRSPRLRFFKADTRESAAIMLVPDFQSKRAFFINIYVPQVAEAQI
ncbi:hypothetical protein B0H11DRAFT_2263113 [Mycena galericulata]|nr:hypothetical protein B0H11DRAFT_2263113 [Mycena galericulata]